MKIYTGYFDILEKLPKDIIPISICGKAPGWYNGIQYKKLAPKLKFFLERKENKDNNFYVKHFNEEVLSKLDKNKVLSELYNLSDGKDIILICYEKPDEFCHELLPPTAKALEVGVSFSKVLVWFESFWMNLIMLSYLTPKVYE